MQKAALLSFFCGSLVVLPPALWAQENLAPSPGPGPAATVLEADSMPVEVQIRENAARGRELDWTGGEITATYEEAALGFGQFPAKYSANALQLDRSVPFVIRASISKRLPAGEYEFRLRARGAARFLVDDSVQMETKPQVPNTTGDDPVPPPPVDDGTPVRLLPYPHQEEIRTIQLDGSVHEFALLAVIGGKGLTPSPGELSVTFNRKGELPRLLGRDDAPLLTDEGWTQFRSDQSERLRRSDASRRTALSASIRAEWDRYHGEVREWMAQQPSLRPPETKPSSPVFNAIDQFIGARLEAAGVTATTLTTDLEFLRRLALDTVGTVPTLEEIESFLADPASERRARAIDYYLHHPGWADHWVSYWQDVLAENPGILKPDLNNSGPFRWWLHQSFTDGLPFDRMVAELIQMEGSIYEGGPAAFKLATLNDAPMAAKADILAQAFLAEKLSCARCHDAPHHEHKQKDTFNFAAMLEGKPVKLPASSTVPLVEGFRKPRVDVTLEPGTSIDPHWPFAELVEPSGWAKRVPVFKDGDAPPSRSLAAAMIVSPDNERFAKVLVNRVWKRYLGAGLVEPAEDWYLTRASHPELLEYLAVEFVRGGYDLKALARLVFSSHLYQRKPQETLAEIPASKDRLFAGPLRRRMSAEQLVDSLYAITSKRFNSEELNLNPAGNRDLKQFLNLGVPRRAWEFTALMNERDRPALALPIAQSIVDVLTTYGWRQSRMNPVSERHEAPSPMQTLLLANGIMGSHIVRLSDESTFTELALGDGSLEQLIEETFLRVLSRPPSEQEAGLARNHLEASFPGRKQEGAAKKETRLASDRRVTWANHLSAEATVIRMEEERRLRQGTAPTQRLKPEFREQYEDLIWSLVNAPEFTLIP